MISLSTVLLADAVRTAAPYEPPRLNKGARYIYDEIYGHLARGEDVRLSGINFDSFDLVDVDTIRDLYFDTIETDESKAETIITSLLGLSPVTAVSAFI